MGTSGTNIKDNDIFQDIYTRFFDRYNSGEDPRLISSSIIEEHTGLIHDANDSNHFWFALALAQWETKTLDPGVLSRVRTIIETSADLDTWRQSGASIADISKRKKVLDRFLAKLKTEKEKPKKRARQRFNFAYNEILHVVAPDGNKVFTIGESILSGKYVNTGGTISWNGGRGSVLHFDKPNNNISARWLDASTLAVTHDKDIRFTKKKFRSIYLGDEVRILYVERLVG